MRAIRTVIGLFTENQDAEGAITTLRDRGYNPKDMSLIMRDSHDAQAIQEHTGEDVGGGAASGAATGAIIGGVAGLLIGLGAIAIPGVGAFLVGGPLAAALGLSGAAATTASGALTGALAGGLIGALMSLGLPREEAEQYETRIKEGAILLAVPAFDDQVQDVKDAMSKFDASDVKTLDAPLAENQDVVGDDREDVRSDERFDRESVDEDAGGFTTHQMAHHRHAAVNPVVIQRYLKHVDYPATKDDLVHEAEEEGADREVIHTLQDLPNDKFESPTDVSQAIGHTHR